MIQLCNIYTMKHTTTEKNDLELYWLPCRCRICENISFLQPMTESPHFCMYVIHTQWHRPGPQEADSEVVCIWKGYWGSALRINVYKSMTGGPGVISEACLRPGWPVELFPSGSRGRDFISQHRAVIVSIAPGKGMCSRDSHPERLCCEQTGRHSQPVG